jgi:hypothetical protein
VRSADVLAAAGIVQGALGPLAGGDWSTPVPGLDFTVTTVVTHLARCLVWYATDLWVGPDDDSVLAVQVAADPANGALLTTLGAAAQVCAASVAAAPDTTRGFHPSGSPDPSGFAAMACDELLVHGDDALRAFGMVLDVPPVLAGAVLARLFPWHDPGDDPWATLRWANGRLALPGRPDQKGWRWRAAPLAEWDGRPPPPRPVPPHT